MSGTELYLIRHGIAAERGTYANDDERPLTESGYRKTQAVADRLVALNLQFDLILTSPLIRARQTAALLKAAGLSEQIEESTYLAPDGDFRGWLDWFQSWQQTEHNRRLALVGHEPNLSEWAEQLVWGDVRQHIILKKAGAVGILVPQNAIPVGHCQLFWLTPPRLLL